MLNLKLVPDHYSESELVRHNAPYLMILALVIAVSALGQWLYFQPKMNTDMQVWLNIARDLGKPGDLAYAPFYYERVFFTGFLWLSGKVFPLTDNGVLALMLSLSAVNVLLVAETTRVVAGRLPALLAAALFAWHPVHLIFGTFLVSDMLANPLALGSLLLLALYLRSERFGYLVAAVFIGGLCFFVKSYTAGFGILAMAIYLLVWLLKGRGSWSRLLAVLIAFLLPILAGHLLHWVVNGDPFFYAKYYASYAARVYGDTGLTLNNIFGMAGLKVIYERFGYLSDLYWEYGVFAAAWGIAVSAFLFFRVRQSVFHLALACLFFGLLLFLLFAPVRVYPLVFVEMQTRYLVLPVALLAIGGGLAVSHLRRVINVKWRADAIFAISVLALSGFLVPEFTGDKYFHRYRVLDYYAVETALHQLDERPGATLLVPGRYREMFPHTLLTIGPEVAFFNDKDMATLERTLESQANRTGSVAVFVPRRQYPRLAENIRISELKHVPEHDVADWLIEELKVQGYEGTPLNVPYTPWRLLGMKIGLRTKGELVGWMYQRVPRGAGKTPVQTDD